MGIALHVGKIPVCTGMTNQNNTKHRLLCQLGSLGAMTDYSAVVISMRVPEREISSLIHETSPIIGMIYRSDGLLVVEVFVFATSTNC